METSSVVGTTVSSSVASKGGRGVTRAAWPAGRPATGDQFRPIWDSPSQSPRSETVGIREGERGVPEARNATARRGRGRPECRVTLGAVLSAGVNRWSTEQLLPSHCLE